MARRSCVDFRTKRLPGLGAVRGGRRDRLFYAALGCVLLGLIFGGLIFVFGEHPQLIIARFVWALLVTYFLMCALFEDFLYPFVIMFSVPPAAVGGWRPCSWFTTGRCGIPSLRRSSSTCSRCWAL